MRRLFQSFIRMSAFVRKEISEILRQPRLLFTLVLGPFLILLIFGAGYKNEARPLRTLFVAQENSVISQQIQDYATTLGPQLIYEGVTPDEQGALERLRQGQVDVVAVTPADAMQRIRNSEHAAFILYHREIDPFQVDYVTYFGQIYIDEVNRRVLVRMTEQGQQDATAVQDDIAEARANASALRQAIQAGDEGTARLEQTQLSGNVNNISLAVGASLALLSGVETTMGPGESGDVSQVLAALRNVQENTDALNSSNPSSGDTNANVARLTEVENDLASLEEKLVEFTSIDPTVLVRPFTSEAKSTAPAQPEAIHFYAPAVIALLLQHLAVTFAALSIVRERSVGTMELFRVSPLTAGETLLGKYLSYMIFGGVIAAALSLLMIYGLKVPMIGDWKIFALTVATILFASLGIGFLISLFSQTESQAVQWTMITLLTSVFFSGFMMSLDFLTRPVRVLSWTLPTTYGIVLLRDIALRGVTPQMTLLGGLALIGLGLCLLSWFFLRRMITTR